MIAASSPCGWRIRAWPPAARFTRRRSITPGRSTAFSAATSAIGWSWTNDESTVFLLQAEPEYLDPPYHRKRVGMNHLAFAVSSKQQVDALATALVARRVPLLYGGPRAGRTTYAVFFEDPDRIKIEVAAPVGS